MQSLSDCTRFHNDKPILAAHYDPSLNKCYIVTQESLKLIDGTTHATLSTFVFPFNNVTESTLEQQKGLSLDPSSVSGTIVGVHFYATSFSMNIVLTFSLGFLCHICNNVLIHIEQLSESVSASAISVYKNTHILLVSGSEMLYIFNLESLSLCLQFSMPRIASTSTLSHGASNEHNYPLEISKNGAFYAILYNTGRCNLFEIKEIDKHSLNFRLEFLGALDLLLPIPDNKTKLITISNLYLVAHPQILSPPPNGSGIQLYIYYLASSMQLNNANPAMSARTLTEASFSSSVRAVSVHFSDHRPSESLIDAVDLQAQCYNIFVKSSFSSMFGSFMSSTLPTRILSLYVTKTNLILHLMDDSLAIYSIKSISSQEQMIYLTDITNLQPIYRYMQSLLVSKKYDQTEKEYISGLGAVFDKHILLDLRLKQIVNRSHPLNKVFKNRIPFLLKSLAGSTSSASHPTSSESAVDTASEDKVGEYLAVLYSSTVFFFPVSFLNAHETLGLPTNFLPEILTPYHMQRLGCTSDELPGGFLQEDADIFSAGVAKTFSPQEDASYDSVPIIPHRLLCSSQQAPDTRSIRAKYYNLVASAFPTESSFLLEVEALINNSIYLCNSEYIVFMASIQALFNTFRAEQRTLELRYYDSGIRSVVAAICATFPPVSVVKERFIILPQRTKLILNYGFPTKSAKTNSLTVMLPAWDLLCHCVISAKILPLSLSGKQFLRVYRQLSHRAILSFIGCGTAVNNAFYIFTEAPPKLRLSHVLKYNNDALKLFKSERRVRVFIRSLLQAINFLYSNDTTLIHRDLRPGQIWVRRNSNGDPLAKIYHIGFMSPLFSQEPVEYNTTWVAPEVVCGGIDVKSDVWSIGTIAFRLLEVLLSIAEKSDKVELNRLFYPYFQKIEDVPSFSSGSGERNLLLANNAIVIHQMMLMASDSVEVAPDRYAIYNLNTFESANLRVRIPWSMRRAYFASTGILPWHNLNYAKLGIKKEKFNNLYKLFDKAISNNVISSIAIDFIQKCWTFDTNKRPSPDVLLNHPWLRSSRQS